MTQTVQPAATRILIVDDDTTFRLRLARALSDRGLEVFDASGGAEALKLAQQHRPQWVLLDLRMPDEGGMELIQPLIQFEPQVRIVVLTGYGSIATAVEALRRGAVNYLTKPADAQQILAAFTQPAGAVDSAAPAPSLARVEWEHIQRVLTDCGGNISATARRLGIHRRSLQRKLAKLPPEE